MAYTALCIAIPEIRISYKGSRGKRIGPVGSVGFALFFWGPGVVILGVTGGLISEAYNTVGYLVGLLGVILAMIGRVADPRD
jgi:hypothetical protein